jgi:hypothetical protein
VAAVGKVLAYVRANPGQRLEEIGRGLRTDTAGLKRPIQVLVADGKLRTEGQKRGTKYFEGGGGRRKAKAAKKAGKAGRKVVGRGKAAKARGRRRGAKAKARKTTKRPGPKQAQAAPAASVAVPEAVQAA